MRTLLMWAMLVCIAGQYVGADEPVSKSRHPNNANGVEQKLAEPAKLQLGDADTITFAELLDAIQQHHGLTIQLDRNAAMLLAMTMEDMVLPKGELAHLPKRKPKAAQYPTYGSAWVPSGSQTIPSAAYLSDDITYYPQGPEVLLAPATQTGAPYDVLPVADGEAPGERPEVVNEDVVLDLVATRSFKPAEDEPQDVQTPKPLPLPGPDPLAPVSPYGEQPVAPDAPANTSDEAAEEFEPGVHALAAYEDMFRKSSINARALRDPAISVEVVLRRAIAQVGTPMESEEMAGMPATYSHAYDWDLRVENETVYITTRLQSNLQKVARVYRVPGDMTAEELALVVRCTVRPWSWTQQIDDVVNMVQLNLPEGMPFPDFPKISKINLTGSGELVEFASGEQAAADEGEETQAEAKSETDPALAWMSMKAMGSLMSSGTVAAAHTFVNTAEMLHFADPPTATMEVLPGMLVISQSRGAHAEIKELIDQISADE